MTRENLCVQKSCVRNRSDGNYAYDMTGLAPGQAAALHELAVS